ncbi:hypothetical protein R1T16_09015 [Flavobacterium sp. DG1-102-2]|uniref:hypothetical protein n=1 Tax=Flavobacterium sp. DG1-102-2 TaxID=3081663 RepID=UPI002948E603|nr:hypothetical protein [Flavobacterium sp. DG1-102-2]MDV6168562.1 hypothetical protein [Flavobacterium sp. DG1-102-2]
MKKINLLVCTLAIAGLGFTSCSDDDNDNTNDTRIEGTYQLDEVNTPQATDFDRDGDSHIDQTEESACYNGGKIVLNADNTFEYVVTGILVQDGTTGCRDTETKTGVYTVEPATDPKNALITLTYTENNQTVTRQFTKIGDELSWTSSAILGVYADRDANGNPIEVSGAVEYVYEK